MTKPVAIASEWLRHDLFDRRHIGLDFSDALDQPHCLVWSSVYADEKSPVTCVTGPTAELRKLEAAGDHCASGDLEEQKSLPWQAVWERIVSVTIRQRVANGWRTCGLRERNFQLLRVNTAGCGTGSTADRLAIVVGS
ncbi:L-rhamnose isomerase [Shigella sonnei]